MPNRRHSSRLLLPGCRAKETNSSFRLMVSLVSQGMMISRRSLSAEKCPPCPRTPVNHVSGAYRLFSKVTRRKGGTNIRRDLNNGYAPDHKNLDPDQGTLSELFVISPHIVFKD